MVQVKIHYSIRKDSKGLPVLRLFSEESCAIKDQELFKFWDTPVYGSFTLDVKGSAYIDEVMTAEEYKEELAKTLDKNTS